jgi:TPR repeat protein
MRYPRISLRILIAVLASTSGLNGQMAAGSSTAIHPTNISGIAGREEALDLFLKRDAKANQLLTKLAGSGDTFAQLLLYWDAGGCDSDSLKLARSLADQGLRMGYRTLAGCEDPDLAAVALDTRSDPRDREKAIMWRRLAREAKVSPKASSDLGKGFNLLRQRAESGNGLAQYYCYEMGMDSQLRLISKGVAEHWLEQAAVKGIPEAEFTLSFYYSLSNNFMGGPGHTADSKLEISWLRNAAGHNFEPAQILLGDSYSRGYVGFTQNLEEGRRWYRLASKNPSATPAQHVAAQKMIEAINVSSNSFAASTKPVKDPTKVDEIVAAVQAGDFASVEKQLAGGAQINGLASEFPEATPLQIAAGAGNPSMVEFLLQHGADVKAEDTSGRTALHSVKGDTEVTRLLLSKGANPNAKDFNGDTPLHPSGFGLDNYKSVAVINTLIAGGADVNLQDFEGETPIIKLLKGVVDCDSYEGIAPTLPIVDAFVAAKADLTLRDLWGNSARSLAQDIRKRCERPSEHNYVENHNAALALLQILSQGPQEK